jgi:alpha-beta hydrolase superfamily lysophospholipase
MLLHFRQSLALMGALLRDSRVSRLRKAIFVGSLGALLLMLLVPELSFDTIVGAVPVAGPVFDLLGVPTEGSLDWLTAVTLLPLLLRVFPAAVVRQHYNQIFHRSAAPAH